MTKKQRRPPLPEMTATKNYQKKNTIVHVDSQPERLLAALQDGPVATPHAIYEMHIVHPACAIHRLRLQGFEIRTVLRPTEFPDGNSAWAAEYQLIETKEG